MVVFYELFFRMFMWVWLVIVVILVYFVGLCKLCGRGWS